MCVRVCAACLPALLASTWRAGLWPVFAHMHVFVLLRASAVSPPLVSPAAPAAGSRPLSSNLAAPGPTAAAAAAHARTWQTDQALLRCQACHSNHASVCVCAPTCNSTWHARQRFAPVIKSRGSVLLCNHANQSINQSMKSPCVRSVARRAAGSDGAAWFGARAAGLSALRGALLSRMS